MQTCLHRLRLDADELRRLLDTHAFDEAGDEHGAEGFRQRVEAVLACACRKLDPDVMMMQSAEDRQRANGPAGLDRSC